MAGADCGAAESSGEFAAGEAAAFSTALVQWFREHRRVLPWREQPSAYKTVVSELMLQQTQVATVLPYFERWLQRWPGFAELAAAEEAQVLQMWEGLGYYSRARNLLKLARAWVAAVDKPQSAQEWLDYPGVGPYTAAAIASIAFGEHAAVVDGNVVRILARIAADETEFASPALAVRAVTPLAQALIAPAAEPGLHNEAMMELGATLCRKGQPQCLLCPVRDFCRGQKQVPELAQLPKIARKATRNRVESRVFVIDAAGEDRGQVCILLCRYSAQSRRLAGLSELPRWELLHRALTAAGVTGSASSAADSNPLPVPDGEPLLVRHRGIANERIEERIYRVELSVADRLALAAFTASAEQVGSRTAPEVAEAGEHLFWLPLAELAGVTLTGPHRRWLQELLKNHAT